MCARLNCTSAPTSPQRQECVAEGQVATWAGNRQGGFELLMIQAGVPCAWGRNSTWGGGKIRGGWHYLICYFLGLAAHRMLCASGMHAARTMQGLGAEAAPTVLV